jgi:hypothetical protein
VQPPHRTRGSSSRGSSRGTALWPLPAGPFSAAPVGIALQSRVQNFKFGEERLAPRILLQGSDLRPQARRAFIHFSFVPRYAPELHSTQSSCESTHTRCSAQRSEAGYSKMNPELSLCGTGGIRQGTASGNYQSATAYAYAASAS